MKRALKAIFTLSLIVMATISFAQQAGGAQQPKKEKMTPEQSATVVSNKMAASLGLNDIQKKQVYALTLEKMKDREAAMKLTPQQRQAEAAKRAEKAKAYKAQMAKILTPAQFKTWEENTAQMRQNRAKHGHGQGHGVKNDGCKCGDSTACKASGKPCANCTCKTK